MEKWLDDLYDLCETVSKELSTANEKIKAAGGIKSVADAEAFLAAGADRLGTSSLLAMLKQEG